MNRRLSPWRPNGARLFDVGRAVRDGAEAGDRIEFLAPRDSAFGVDSPAEFVGVDDDDLPPPDDAEPRSRWLAATAGLALTALIVGGVVAAAPWDSPAATPAPATLPHDVPTRLPATTVPVDEQPDDPAVTVDDGTDTAAPVAPLTGLVFDPLPPGLAVFSAWSNGARWEDPDMSGWGEVFATPDATRITGAWYSLTLVNFSEPHLSSNSSRVDLGGRVGLLEQQPEGILRLTASIGQTDSTQTLSITSYGRTQEQLIAFFTSIGIDDDRPQLVDDRPKYLDPSLLEGFNLVASRATNQDLLDTFLWGTTETGTYYANSTGERYISVDTSPRDGAMEPLGRLAIGPVRIVPDAADVPTTFTGEDLVFGVSPSGSDPTVIARWHDDDTTISVRSTLPLGELLELLPTLRRTTDDEWMVVKQRVRELENQRVADDEVQAGTLGPAVRVADGTSTSGVTWSVTAHSPDRMTVQIGGASVVFAGTPVQPIQVWSSDSTTVVTVFTDLESPFQTVAITAGGQHVNYRLEGQSETDPAGSFAGAIGAYTIEQTGPFLVEVRDVNGEVVAEYRSPGFAEAT